MQHDNAEAPIVIGAVGGSGTRVLVDVLGAAGVFMGARLNASNDALDFVHIYDRWIDPLWRGELSDRAALAADLRAAASAHCAPLADPGQPWGWKNPRVIYLLDTVDRLWPGLRFIHLVRDVRDMAFSPNQNQLRLHGDAVLGAAHADTPTPVRAAALWSRINASAADLGQRRLGQRYLRVRFEDLCAEPLDTLGTLFERLQLPNSASAELATLVSAPNSLGRWRQQAPDLIARIDVVAGETRRALGYGAS